LNRKFRHELSLLHPRAADSRSGWGRILTHGAWAHLVLQVATANVEGKGLDEVRRKPLASELVATHRAARISSLENIDSQRCLAFQHAPIVPQYSPYVYVNDLVTSART
jgi:hypothetical protein